MCYCFEISVIAQKNQVLQIALFKPRFRACSHEPGTVNYPRVMIAPGKALPRVHMMICCPGAMLPRVNFIAPGQVHRYMITTKLENLLQALIMSMRKTTLAPGQLLRSVHMEKSYLGKAGYPVLYNG